MKLRKKFNRFVWVLEMLKLIETSRSARIFCYAVLATLAYLMTIYKLPDIISALNDYGK